MSYHVLARKWRPQTFADVVGQKYVLTAITNSLLLGRVHHAYIFSGTRGVGKTTIARLLAKGLNCETGITATPCGVCNNCRDIEHGRFIDLIEIDAASRTKVEDTRDLLDNVQYAPTYGRIKVYLIDEVHMLSRHSFNALLKTLEEPPVHVKFLLATTDPKKLPITILSRCLQFHLRALEVEQIQYQLKYILDQEQVAYDQRALQLLARAAEGSMRDALSLTDQAIAISDNKLSTEVVTTMLGKLNDDQALSLIEIIVAADGKRAMKMIDEISTRGVEWEEVLVEMQSLLHSIAMVQLSPAALDTEIVTVEHRIRILARIVPPTDVQLYYQTLLVGRRELPFAPDKRMGVEMTILRMLAFHPTTPSLKSEALQQVPTHKLSSSRSSASAETTSQTITTHSSPQYLHKVKQDNKSSEISNRALSINNYAHKCSISTIEHIQSRLMSPSVPVLQREGLINNELYYWISSLQKSKIGFVFMKKKIKCKKILELVVKIINNVIELDVWAAEISKLKIPEVIGEIALNAWKEQTGNQVRLHLRSEKYHLNSLSIQKTLTKALSALNNTPVELTIIEDDDLAVRTPIEWVQVIYEERLARAKETIISDNNIHMLQHSFNAELDEDSIYPI